MSKKISKASCLLATAASFLVSSFVFDPAHAEVVQVTTADVVSAGLEEAVNSSVKILLSGIKGLPKSLTNPSIQKFVVANFDDLANSISSQVIKEASKTRGGLTASILASIIVDKYVEIATNKLLESYGDGLGGATIAAVNEHIVRLGANVVLSKGNPGEVAIAQGITVAKVYLIDLPSATQEAVRAAVEADAAKLRMLYGEVRLEATRRIARGDSLFEVMRYYDTEVSKLKDFSPRKLIWASCLSLSIPGCSARSEISKYIENLHSLHATDIRGELEYYYHSIYISNAKDIDDILRDAIEDGGSVPIAKVAVPAPEVIALSSAPIVQVQSHYEHAPDLSDDLQQEIIDAAEPTDPPTEALWAGRMSLSGHFFVGTDSEAGPVTGVVTAMEASGEAPVSDFILFRPEQGSMRNPIQGVQTTANIGHNFSHLMWGSWVGGERTWLDTGSSYDNLSGFFVYGELTSPTARSSGVATYTGRLRGDVLEEGGVIQSGLAFGDFGLTANFGSGALAGWLAIAADNSTNYVFVSNISNANIVRQSDNLHFYGDIGTNLQEGMGHIEGYFFGANATELGGTYELSSSVGGSTHGILLGWETGTMPTKPVFADGSKRAHISTQMPDGYILDSSLDILTVPAQGQPSVALAVPQEQGGGTVSTSQVYAQNGYSYTSWGKWRANDSTPDSYSNGGYWAAGDATSGSVIQNKSGSATYSGEIIGDHVSNGVRQAAEGSIHLTADFNADRISGDMEFHTETTSMTPALIDTVIQGSGYFGQISNDSANGNFAYGVQGNFFGPNADEIGGSAWASTDEGTYNGVFRAKQ